jgi:hypothetical protein
MAQWPMAVSNRAKPGSIMIRPQAYAGRKDSTWRILRTAAVDSTRFVAAMGIMLPARFHPQTMAHGLA